MIISLLKWETTMIPAVEDFLGEKITECRTYEAALQAIPEADIVITTGGAPLLTEELIAAAKNLKLVLSASAGVEKLPLKALHDRDIAVCNAKGAYSGAIAEFVVGGMLAWSHHFPMFIRNQINARWQSIFSGDNLEGKTLVVIGAGSIGQAIAKKAKALDMTVIGLRRRPEPTENFDEIHGNGDLRAVLPRADFAVLATPLTPETYHLMGAEEFRCMKPSAVFINIARGDACDEAALIEALQSKQIAGAILDVFSKEPLPPESPLWTFDNVIVTPHSSASSDSSGQKTIDYLRSNIVRFRKGEPLMNQIKKGEMY
jgi:phosphoglycerate dehydrogenase-like enzyme